MYIHIIIYKLEILNLLISYHVPLQARIHGSTYEWDLLQKKMGHSYLYLSIIMKIDHNSSVVSALECETNFLRSIHCSNEFSKNAVRGLTRFSDQLDIVDWGYVLFLSLKWLCGEYVESWIGSSLGYIYTHKYIIHIMFLNKIKSSRKIVATIYIS